MRFWLSLRYIHTGVVLSRSTPSDVQIIRNYVEKCRYRVHMVTDHQVPFHHTDEDVYIAFFLFRIHNPMFFFYYLFLKREPAGWIWIVLARLLNIFRSIYISNPTRTTTHGEKLCIAFLFKIHVSTTLDSNDLYIIISNHYQDLYPQRE